MPAWMYIQTLGKWKMNLFNKKTTCHLRISLIFSKNDADEQKSCDYTKVSYFWIGPQVFLQKAFTFKWNSNLLADHP